MSQPIPLNATQWRVQHNATAVGQPRREQPLRSHRTSLTCLGALLLLSACGGGGGNTVANQAPTAVPRLVGEAVAQAEVILDSSASTDSDGSIAQRSWAYGDGQTGTSDRHTYAAPGSYSATLTVTDNQGATAATALAVVVAKCSAAGTQAAALSPFTTVCVQTSQGEMVFEVFPALAPATVANFLRYVDDGFYAGTLVHRVIAGFVMQGGGFTAGPTAKPTPYAAIALESDTTLRNWQYTLAMARGTAPASATSQWYINLVDNHDLDHDAALPGPNGYAVFGQVISGIGVVDEIGKAVTSTRNGMANVPVADIVVRSMLRMP